MDVRHPNESRLWQHSCIHTGKQLKSKYRGVAAPEFRRGAVRQMMKIKVNELDKRLILEVEGRLAGAFVPELESCWMTACARQTGRNVVVDLKNVTCVDRAGRSLLQRMHCSGVGFLRAGIATQDILEQIM